MPLRLGVYSLESFLVLPEPASTCWQDLSLVFAARLFYGFDPGPMFFDPVDEPLPPIDGDPLVSFQVLIPECLVGDTNLGAERSEPFGHPSLACLHRSSQP
ncbi:uncharacterized protein METZ01_LOCUS501836, partial [marine metagenome]